MGGAAAAGTHPTETLAAPNCSHTVRQKVSSGRYNSASEVVREALRLMEAEDQLRAARLKQLRHDIHEGLQSGPADIWAFIAEDSVKHADQFAAYLTTSFGP